MAPRTITVITHDVLRGRHIGEFAPQTDPTSLGRRIRSMLSQLIPVIYKLGPSMINRLIMTKMTELIPFNRLLGVELREVGDGYGCAYLPRREDLLNHIGTVHATAIYGLAEAASGCAMAGAMAPFIAGLKPIAASAKIEYLRTAKSDLKAIAKTAERPATLRSQLTSERTIRFSVDAEVFDADDQHVASVCVQWHVSLR